MSATERIRALLDERGVEWRDEETELDRVTEWGVADMQATFFEAKGLYNHDLLQVCYYDHAPEQAVEATLGRGTCRYEIGAFGDGKVWYECTECGGMASADYDPPSYCPHCGRRVIGEEDE